MRTTRSFIVLDKRHLFKIPDDEVLYLHCTPEYAASTIPFKDQKAVYDVLEIEIKVIRKIEPPRVSTRKKLIPRVTLRAYGKT